MNLWTYTYWGRFEWGKINRIYTKYVTEITLHYIGNTDGTQILTYTRILHTKWKFTITKYLLLWLFLSNTIQFKTINKCYKYTEVPIYMKIGFHGYVTYKSRGVLLFLLSFFFLHIIWVTFYILPYMDPIRWIYLHNCTLKQTMNIALHMWSLLNT